MTLVGSKFTPEVLISAPRPSAAVPNSSGTLALLTVTKYSFESHSKSGGIRVLDIKTGELRALYEEVEWTDPNWVSETEFIFINASGGHGTSLMLADATKPGAAPRELKSFTGTLSHLKVAKISDDVVAIACSAPARPDGTMQSARDEPKPLSTARVYTKLFVRHWDKWNTENTNSIWYGALKREQAGASSSSSSFSLQGRGLVNALAGTGLESPVPPFPGTCDFDLGREGLVFVAKDPDLNAAMFTKSDLYYVPLKTFTEEKPPAPQVVKTGALQGYSGCPTFSHDGKKLAFKRMRDPQYESDKSRLLLMPNIRDLSDVQELYRTEDGQGGWRLNPGSINWSHDDKELIVTAEETGRTVLFKLPASQAEATSPPKAITQNGSISAVFNLAENDGRLFVQYTSLIESGAYSIVDPASETNPETLVFSSSKEGRSLGLNSSQLDEFWFQGAGDYKLHALVMKPSDFEPRKKYPLALLLHGGPQGAWTDSWSTRWNPAVFAEQGYVVVMANPTGSTGYGQELTDGIAQQWGGRPYVDLENCFQHIASRIPWIDTDRAVALGASFGGYMINWIQGHPLGRKFRALVCHDGIFSTMNDWATEELFFVLREMGGTLWDRRDLYERWDPAVFADAWATPQLVIHSELDYRLPVSEGLAAFNVLQARGVPSRLLVFPDENHWVLKHENSLVWHQEVLGWINKYVGI